MQDPNLYTFQDIDPDFKVALESKPSFASIPQDFSDAIFEKASESKPLFDGTLVCVKEFTPKLVTTYSISFKEYLAANQFPNYPHLHTPLAVSGWIIHRDRVLLGVRSKHVYSFSGYMELVPSGGIDGNSISKNHEIHFQKALELEFEEETGMSCEVIESIRPEALIFCSSSSLYDICQSIHIHQDTQIDCDASNEEYSQLFWVPLKELAEFTQTYESQMIPTSLAIIKSKLLP